MVGESYIHVSPDAATEFVTKRVEALERTLEDLGNEVVTIKKTLDELKAALYGKFKDQINLEYD